MSTYIPLAEALCRPAWRAVSYIVAPDSGPGSAG
jgi:hypothetical protein